MGLLFEARRERRFINRKKNKINVRDVLESYAKDSEIPDDQRELLASNYSSVMTLADELFPHANSSEDLADLVAKHPKFAGKPPAQQTYGSITTILTVIKILMTLYDLWKKYQASKA